MNPIAQYDSFLSIYICLLAIVPCVIAGFLNKRSKVLNLIISIVMIVTILGFKTIQMLEFLLFIICEVILIYLYLWYRKKHNGNLVYFLTFALSILPLFIIRVSGMLEKFNTLLGFVGISYICFKIWQVLFEIHDGKIESIKPLDLVGLLLFFPTYSSGPIIRSYEMDAEYSQELTRREYATDYLIIGLKKIALGLFYKFALAFYINMLVIEKLPASFGEASIWQVILYAYAYTVYLFFDFAGYSKIAIGFGYLMGIKVPENFDKPFLARNMKEFWARWHMSLSRWFNDYIFGRFVLNGIRKKRFSSQKVAARCAYMVTMTTMGLWHGFTLHYLVYGLYEGAILVATDVYVRSKLYRKYKKKKWFDIVSRIVCFQFIALGMLIFSGHFWAA